MIHGITPSLAEAGKIKIGGLSDQVYTAKASGHEYRLPEKHDHFTVTTNTRDSDGRLIVDDDIMNELLRLQPGKLRSIPIVLHSDEIDDVFPTVYAMYASKSLACSGDGQTATRWKFDGKIRTSDTKELKCPCDLLGAKKGHTCKPHGTLNCSIALSGHAIAGAVYKFRTTGLISIQRIIGSLQQILGTAGTLTGIPLALVLQPVQVSPDGRTATVYSCHVELRARDLVETQKKALEAREMRKQLGGRVPMLLIEAPAAVTESPEEQAEVCEEYYPDTEAAPEQKKEGAPSDVVKNAAKRTAAAIEPGPSGGDTAGPTPTGRGRSQGASIPSGEKDRCADSGETPGVRVPSEPLPEPEIIDNPGGDGDEPDYGEPEG